MSPLTSRRVAVVSTAVLLILSAGLAAPTTLAPEDYTISIDGSIDIPDQTVTVEGSDYDVRAFGRFDPGERITVDVSAPADREYRVNLYNWNLQVADTYAMTGSGEAQLETDGLQPGTYFVAVVKDGYQKIFPVVIEGYDLALSAGDSAERGSTVDVSLSATRQASTDPPNAVQVVLGNDSTAMRVEATRTGTGSYEATVPTDSLSPGTYALYGVIRGEKETDSGEKITVAVTDRADLRVTEPSTPTATPTNSGGGGTSGGGSTGGDGSSTATSTPSATPTPTVTSTASPTTPTVTPTTTPTAGPTPPTTTPTPATATPTDGTVSPTISPSPTGSPTQTVADDGPVTPRETTRPPTASATAGDGPGFGVGVSLLALLAGTLLLARRH